MAEIESDYRNFVILFKEYMDDPVAFRAKEAEQLATVKKEGGWISTHADEFMELYQVGVRPSDLEYISERQDEREEDIFDYAASLEQKNGLQLRGDILKFRIKEILKKRILAQAFAGAGESVQTIERSGDSLVTFMLEVMRNKGTKSADILLYQDALEEIADTEANRRAAQIELLKRKGHSSKEPAA